MKKILFPISFIFFSVLMTLSFNACVDKDFDMAPIGVGQVDTLPSNIVVNTTIAQLKDIYLTEQSMINTDIVDINQDIVIEGVVTSSDLAGNFYREFYFEDATGGAKLSFDYTDLHNDFPVGTRVVVNINGLKLDYFSEILAIGASVGDDGFLDGLPQSFTEEHVYSVEFAVPVTPNVVTINELGSDDLMGTLITLEEVEMIPGEIGLTYATGGADPQSENRNLTDCNGNTLVLRSSGFSDFADEILPSGNGSITGIATRFLSTNQLVISNTNDVNMTAELCDGSSGGGGTGNETQASISSIRNLFTGTETTAPAETKIVGTVISDRIEANVQSRNIVVQDATGGIVVRFASDHFFNLNDEVEIIVSGQEVSEFRGVLQLNNIPNNNASVTGSGNVTPTVVSVSDLLSSLDDYESTLVRVEGATLTGGNTYNGTLVLNDGTGDIDVYTGGGAGFSGALAPTNGETVSMNAIAGEFTFDGDPQSPQLNIRNLGDVSSSGGNPPGNCEIDATFTGATDFNPVNQNGWVVQEVEGVDQWVYKSFDGNSFIEMRSFQATSPENEAWTVTPSIDISTQQVFSFNSATAFWEHDGLAVLISTNYSGDVESATWTDLNPTLAGSASGNYNWVNSGDINLPVGTTAHIAFRYIGSSASGDTSTYRVDDVKVCEP